MDPVLAAAFPGRSPRELLGALEKGRGGLYDALRDYAKTAPRAAVGPGPLAQAAGAGSRIGAAGLWDCRRTRPTFYACLADGERLQRSPWGRLKVNPLPRGFGEKLRGLIRQGLRPRDAMREAWRRIRLAEDPERLPLRVQRRRYAMRRTVDWQENPRGYPTGPVPARMVSGNPRPGTLPRPWGYLTQEVRLHRSKRYDPATAPKLRSPQEVLQFVKNLPESDRERVFSIYVDHQNRVLGVQPLSVGGTTSAMIPADALMRGALLANATGVILVHNHPSGEPVPSQEDRATTAQLERTLPTLDLRLLDHLVVGRQEATSIKTGQRVPMPNPARRRRASRATYCPERVAAKGQFDPRSFRTVVTDDHKVTVGCPKGQYDARRKRCKVGTRAQRILHPPGESTCPLPGREVRPRRRRRRENPPAGPVEIYRRVEFIGATNHQGSRDPGARFLHRFRTRARMLGLPDGSLLIQPAQGR